MKVSLSKIATISTGIYTKPIPNGTIGYLQVKNFNNDGELIAEIIPELQSSDQTEKHLLNEGDLVFAAKGIYNFAAVYHQSMGKCVASSTFLVIRLNQHAYQAINPDYLAWYFNHPQTRDKIKSMASGTSMPSLSKADLMSMEITVPSIRKQEIIVEVSKLRKKEAALANKIQQLKEKYIQHRLILASNK